MTLQWNQRIVAGVVGIAVFVAAIWIAGNAAARPPSHHVRRC
jgi:hypothetical protein